MKRIICAVQMLVLTVPVWAGDWVLPWVATKDGEWRSEIVINNLSDTTATVGMTAVRPSGEQETELVTVPPFSQWASAARDLFVDLGSGSGYTVFCSADVDSMTIAARVASEQAASGFSPSMGSAVDEKHAATTLVYPTMPADGFSAPAVVNLGQEEATVQISAFTATGQFGETFHTTIPGRTPYANVVTNLFPGLSEGAYLVVRSNTAVVGANFSFNTGLEPSMITAVPGTEVDTTVIEPLLAGLATTATVADVYNMSTSTIYDKRRDCPDVTSDVSLTNPEQFIVASVDYGSGCTDALGVYHSGSLGLNLAREGGLSGGWMTGAMTFNNFESRYNGNAAEVDGAVALEGSTISKNFTLIADLQISADAPTFETSGDLAIDAMLNVNLSDTVFRVFGNLTTVVDALYIYDLNAVIASSDPLIYDYLACQWPSDGRIDFVLHYSGRKTAGWLDFGTGSCTTVTLNMRNQQQTIDLNGLY